MTTRKPPARDAEIDTDPVPHPIPAPSDAPRAVSPAEARRVTCTEDWAHAAAEERHGWRAHEHHEQRPMLLSIADYEQAVRAAIRGGCHGPAESQHSPHRKASR